MMAHDNKASPHIGTLAGVFLGSRPPPPSEEGGGA